MVVVFPINLCCRDNWGHFLFLIRQKGQKAQNSYFGNRWRNKTNPAESVFYEQLWWTNQMKIIYSLLCFLQSRLFTPSYSVSHQNNLKQFLSWSRHRVMTGLINLNLSVLPWNRANQSRLGLEKRCCMCQATVWVLSFDLDTVDPWS